MFGSKQLEEPLGCSAEFEFHFGSTTHKSRNKIPPTRADKSDSDDTHIKI